LFQSPFTKFEDPNHLNPNSSGMGLYICHQIVKAMGGQIKARHSSQGTGSRFVFEVPFAKVPILQRGGS